MGEDNGPKKVKSDQKLKELKMKMKEPKAKKVEIKKET